MEFGIMPISWKTKNRGKLMPDHAQFSRAQWIALALLSLLYSFVGWSHMYRPDGFIAITPQWVPFPEQVIYWTEIAEISGAIGLWIPRLRPAAAFGLSLYAICVWPANINHAVNAIAINGKVAGLGYHIPRLLFQPVLIWVPLWAAGFIHWPFKRKA